MNEYQVLRYEVLETIIEAENLEEATEKAAALPSSQFTYLDDFYDPVGDIKEITTIEAY